MVISLGFGLLFGTLIVLFLLPAFLTGAESMRQRTLRIRSYFIAMLPNPGETLNAARVRRMTENDPTAAPGTRGEGS
jgi:hypothetical protein